MKTPFVLLALLLAATSTLRADEAAGDPDALYDAGWYEAALKGYAASARRARDEHAYVRALMGALKSEMLLTRRAEALARGRAARLPADVGLRAVVEIERLQLFISLEAAYGFADDKAARSSPASSPAKPSRAAAVRDAEAAAQMLWRDRQALARLPLSRLREFFALDGADLTRFPSVWDFAVVRLSLYLRMRPDPGRPTVDLLAENVPHDFASTRSIVDRLAALFEESSHLDGGAVDRKSAAERWKVDRALLGIPFGDQAKALRPRAVALLRGWAHTMATPLGRADAALQAAMLLHYEDQPVEAEMLVEPALAEIPQGMLAQDLRGLLGELRNCTLDVSTRVTRDGKAALHVRARNLSKLYLRLYRLDPLRDLHEELSYTNPQLSFKLVERLTKTLPVAVSWSAALGDAGDRRGFERDLDVPAPGLGLYLLLASDDADFAYSRAIVSAALVSVMDVAVARVRTGDAVRYYAFDAASGAPAAKVPFHLMVAHKPGRPVEERVVTDAHGMASWTYPTSESTSVETLAQHGDGYVLFRSDLARQRDSRRSAAAPPPLALLVTSDRPAYRPGQTVQARVTALVRAGDGGYDFADQRPVRLVLRDGGGAEVAHADLVTGALGSTSTALALPAAAKVGSYTLTATAEGAPVGQPLSLHVEDAPPALQVQLEPPARVVRYGEQLRIRGHVTNAAGAPAAHVKLRFTASPERWLPPFLEGSSRLWRIPSHERTEGQLQSDGAGAFTVELVATPARRVRMVPDPGLRDVPDVNRLTVDVEAREPGGRRVGRRCVVTIGEQALWWSVQSARGFFLSDEPPELRVEATRFDEQPLAASAHWTVERLGEPDSQRDTPYGLPLQADLSRYPAVAEVAHGALDTNGQDAAALKLPALPAGLYRLRLEGGGGRGSFAFLVVDAQTGTLPGVLPSVAIARRDVYQPGETAELLIGGGGAAGRYQLETWQGGARMAQRIDAGPPLRLVRVPLGDAVGERTVRWMGAAGVATKSADVALSVRRPSPSLSIRLVGQTQRLAPGQPLRLGVEVVDDHGQPVDGEALVSLIDDDLAPFAPRAGDWRCPPDAPPPPLPPHEGSVAGDQAIYLHDPKAAAWSSSGSQAGPREVDIAAAAPRFAWEKPPMPFGYGAIEPGRHVSPDAPEPPSSWVPAPTPAEPERPLDPQLPSGRLGPLPAAELETAAWQPALALPAGHGALELRLPERRTRWRLRILVSGRHGELGSRDLVLATE